MAKKKNDDYVCKGGVCYPKYALPSEEVKKTGIFGEPIKIQIKERPQKNPKSKKKKEYTLKELNEMVVQLRKKRDYAANHGLKWWSNGLDLSSKRMWSEMFKSISPEEKRKYDRLETERRQAWNKEYYWNGLEKKYTAQIKKVEDYRWKKYTC
jgi:hypothetical protein